MTQNIYFSQNLLKHLLKNSGKISTKNIYADQTTDVKGLPVVLSLLQTRLVIVEKLSL